MLSVETGVAADEVGGELPGNRVVVRHAIGKGRLVQPAQCTGAVCQGEYFLILTLFS